MSDQSKQSKFWESFNKKEFKSAQERFEGLEPDEKQAVFQELFQKKQNQRMPFMVSILRRELNDGKSFNDFYQSWFPHEGLCNKIEYAGQLYQQHFPVPVRVLNAINVNNAKDIISVGLTWVRTKAEEQAILESVEKAQQGKNKINELRHEQIMEVAQGELLGLFRVEADDNLGTPF